MNYTSGLPVPNITWGYVRGGEEVPLIEGEDYQSESSSTEEGSGVFTKTNTLTMLNVTQLFLSTGKAMVVRCNVGAGESFADAHLFMQ